MSVRDRLSQRERESEAQSNVASQPTDWVGHTVRDAMARTIDVAEKGTLRDRQELRESVAKTVEAINELMKHCGTKINGKRTMSIDDWLSLPEAEQRYIRESLEAEKLAMQRRGGQTVIFRGRI